jgi:hypothetical protein
VEELDLFFVSSLCTGLESIEFDPARTNRNTSHHQANTCVLRPTALPIAQLACFPAQQTATSTLSSLARA